MSLPSIIGFLVCLIGVQWLPMPRWRVLAGLVAISLIVVGIDIIAVLELPIRSVSSSKHWVALAAGALVGAGFGYFLRWVRFCFRD